jgi:3-mercaptopyruvate sulfurtransferase SseA
MSQSVLSHGTSTKLTPRIYAIALAGLILTAIFVGMPAQTCADDTYQQISASELKSMIDSSPEILVIDSQPPFHYRLGHIPRAVNFEMPMEEMASWDTAKTGGKTQEDFIALLGPDQGKPLIF